MIKIPCEPWTHHSHGYWLKKYHPDAGPFFFGYAEYNKWLKKNFNASDKSGKYIYFKTEEDKFLYMTTFKTMPEL